jgi:hypothetical protein
LRESLSAQNTDKRTSILINYLFFRVTRKNALTKTPWQNTLLYNYVQGTLLETQRPGHCTVLVYKDNKKEYLDYV